MAGKEEAQGFSSSKFHAISIAEMISGKSISSDDKGYQVAQEELDKQHQRIMPRVPEGTTIYLILRYEPDRVERLGTMAAVHLETKDYASALVAANHLFIYGNTAYLDSIESSAFTDSLHTHRAFVHQLTTEEPPIMTPLFVSAQVRLSPEIEKARHDRNPYREIELLRELIHTAALEDGLGQDAKRYFDPKALIKDIK